MKANIYLYEDCRLTMSNNFTCDNVESHLATLAYNVGEYNFQKLDYSMSIKTTLNQSEIRPKKYNYAKVVQDGKPYYYYVSSIE